MRSWVVNSPLPSRFQHQVWERITRAEAGPERGFWAAFVNAVEVALPRPKLALSYLASLLILGVAAGSVLAQIRANHLDASLRDRYVQSIDPYHGESRLP